MKQYIPRAMAMRRVENIREGQRLAESSSLTKMICDGEGMRAGRLARGLTLMVGTVSKESRQASKVSCSWSSSCRASSAAFLRSSLFLLTTSFKSSTLYTRPLTASLMSGAMLRGTLMSKNRRRPPTFSEGADMPVYAEGMIN